MSRVGHVSPDGHDGGPDIAELGSRRFQLACVACVDYESPSALCERARQCESEPA